MKLQQFVRCLLGRQAFSPIGHFEKDQVTFFSVRGMF